MGWHALLDFANASDQGTLPFRRLFSGNALISKVSMEEARWGAAFPGNIVPMCMILGKCAGFRAKTVEISGHLPSLYRRALEIFEQRLGLEHLYSVSPLIWLAALYKAQNDDRQAELCSQRALHILKQASHFTYLDFADILHDLAALQQTRGHVDEAQFLYKHTLAIQRQVLGNEHPKTTDHVVS